MVIILSAPDALRVDLTRSDGEHHHCDHYHQPTDHKPPEAKLVTIHWAHPQFVDEHASFETSPSLAFGHGVNPGAEKTVITSRIIRS
jgi:hypothetical protein